MFSRLFVMFFAVVTAVTPAFGDGAVAVAEVQTLTRAVQNVALGRLDVAGLAEITGSTKTAEALFGAVGVLKAANGGALNSVDMAAINSVLAERKLDVSQSAELIIAASTSKEFAKGKNIRDVFSTTQLTAATSYKVVTEDGTGILNTVTPTTVQGKAGLKKLLGNFDRSGRLRKSAAAAALVMAATITPKTCLAEQESACANLGTEVVLSHVARDYDLTSPGNDFRDEILDGWAKSPDSFAAKKANIGPLSGAVEALNMDAMPKALDTCFRTGKPPAL